MPPSASRLPAFFQIILSCIEPSEDALAEIQARTSPPHPRIDICLDAFAQLAPLLDLPEGEVCVTTAIGRTDVTVAPRILPKTIMSFLIELVQLGADDLAEIHRQVEGYPYERIAKEYERLTRAAKRTRRSIPQIGIDASPLLPIRVMDVLGDPATTIRLSRNRDVIRLRGVPFNQPFARLANELILRKAQVAIKAHLPILGNPRRPKKFPSSHPAPAEHELR